MRAGGRALAPAAAPFAGGEQPRLRLAAIAAMAPAARLAWSIEEAGAAPPAARPDETLLYAHTLCPYAERFALTMHEIGVEFRLVHVDLARKPGWFRGLGSRGRVPAAAHGGRTRAESLDPCRTTWSSARRRSRRRGRSSTRRVRPAARFAAALDAAVGAPLARHGGPFLLGASHPAIANLALVPSLRRFAVAIPAFGGADVRGAYGGAVGAWLDAFSGADW